MKILKNLKITTKLLLLTTVLSASMIVVGLIGIFYNQKSTDSLKDVYENNMKGVINLSDMRTQSRANYANIINMMITRNESDRKEIVANFQTRKDNIQKDYDAFMKTKLTSDQEQLASQLKVAMADWATSSDKIMKLLDDDKIDEGITLFKGEGETVFESFQSCVRDLEKNQTDTAEQTYQDSSKSNKQAIQILWILVVAATVISNGLAFFIARSISHPVKKIMQLIKTTANLDLTPDDSYDYLLSNKDEMGDITHGVADLREALRNTSLNLLSLAEKLSASSQELASSSEENSKAIDQIAISISEIAQGNTEQSNGIMTASNSVDDLVHHVEDINHASQKNATLADESMIMIQDGQNALNLNVEKLQENMKVSEAVSTSITELSEQMQKVGAIVDVIREISSQTNLLALNASIEAARAGEAGRGFAVVAGEIGTLAQNTASAVDDIVHIIDVTIEKNKTTATKANEVRTIADAQSHAIKTMEEAFSRIQSSVKEIASQTVEITSKINGVTITASSISEQMQNMSSIAQETAAGSEEISASSEEQLASTELLASLANDLAGMAEDLNEEVHKFQM